jgi:hypothetical protein
MNKLTTISTIKKAAPLALLAVVMSGSAFAGPKGERPAKGKLSIDVYNACTASGTSLHITTTATPSDSKRADGGAEVQTPTAYAAFKGEVCEENKGGKLKCSTGFVPAGQGDAIDDYMDMAGDLTWTKSIDLCALDSSLTAGTAVNAEISVPVKYDGDITTTWVSSCDDDPATYCTDADGYPYVCEKYDESIVEVKASCSQ